MDKHPHGKFFLALSTAVFHCSYFIFIMVEGKAINQFDDWLKKAHV